MKKADLGQVITVIANLGVIVGIVFLALELQQNNELLASEGRINRTNQVREIWQAILDHPELADFFVKDRNGEPLSEAEELLLNAFWMSTLMAVQWQYLEGIEFSLSGLIRNARSYGSLRRTWQGGGVGSRAAGRDNFDPNFVRFVEENIPELTD